MITREVTQFLFSTVSEVVEQTHLSAKEKIPKLRSVLESLFKELTKEEPQLFSNLYSRCIFIFDRYPVPPELTEEIYGLRNLANKVVHESSFHPSDEDYLAGVKAICLALSYFSNEPVPNVLAEQYANIQNLTLQRRPVAVEIVPFVRATVLRIGEIHITDNNSRWRAVFCNTEELGAVNILFWNDFSDIGEISWKFATLHLFNIKKHRETLYTTTKDSLVVLEPDFLVNTTDIAECFHQKYLFSWDDVPGTDSASFLKFIKDNFGISWPENAEINKTDDNKIIQIRKDNNLATIKLNELGKKASLEIGDGRTHGLKVKRKNDKLHIYYQSGNPFLYLLKKFIGFTNTEPIILGKIVNDVFDELLRNSEARFEKIFENAIRQNLISLLSLHLSNDSTVNNMRQRAQGHYDRLQSTVTSLERNSATIEPTFLSDEYGLQGRLDVMLEYTSVASTFKCRIKSR